MSKRTTRTESSEPSAPAPRTRKASPAEPTAAAPKTPRLRKKTVEPAAAAPVNGHSAPKPVGTDRLTIVEAEPSYEQIATRAYFIALERGFQTDPLSDWLVAERELRTSARS
jgi:hypothetical protein